MTKTINDIIAESEIRDLQMLYCRGADRMDFELIRSCFHPDATTDFGFFGGTVDEFIETGREGMQSYVWTTHNTGNQLIRVCGDKALAERYAVVTHRLPAEETQPLRDFVTAIRYVDKLERRNGEWRILHRKLILDWCRTDPVSSQGIVPDVSPGQRDKSDPSYAILESMDDNAVW